MKAIRRVVWDSDTRAGRLFDATVLTVIVAGLVVDAMATLPSLEAAASHILGLVSAGVTTLFVAEYLLRVATAEHRWRYVASFYGIIDLVAILPTLLGLDLRALRAVRLIRLLRVLKITRTHALSRFLKALWSVRD